MAVAATCVLPAQAGHVWGKLLRLSNLGCFSVNRNDTKRVVLSLPGGPAEVTTHMQCLGQCMSRDKHIVSH